MSQKGSPIKNICKRDGVTDSCGRGGERDKPNAEIGVEICDMQLISSLTVYGLESKGHTAVSLCCFEISTQRKSSTIQAQMLCWQCRAPQWRQNDAKQTNAEKGRKAPKYITVFIHLSWTNPDAS